MSIIFSAPTLRHLEQQALSAGVDLMYQAACALRHWVRKRYTVQTRILVAVGPGNNGGDALGAAQGLHNDGYPVDVLLPQPESHAITTDVRYGPNILNSASIYPTLPTSNPGWGLIIDGLFGIGVKRDLNEPWLSLIGKLNTYNTPILSVDTPSGLNAWTGHPVNACIKAQDTLTFLCYKPGLFMGEGRDLAGKTELAPLDCSPVTLPKAEGELNLATPLQPLVRRHNSHKGSYGTVIVEGGAAGMTGAALLAGRSAYAAGAGKVHVVLASQGLIVDPLCPELLLNNTMDNIYTPNAILAIGPGLGQSDKAAQRVAHSLKQPNPLILDADALNLISTSSTLITSFAQRTAPSIMTPHPAEAARLLCSTTAVVQSDRLAAARMLAQRFQTTVVLKGSGTLIVQPSGFFRLNTSGGPALASAGQGDVLTGLIAALWAQNLPAFDAASLAVRLHSLAGDRYTETAHGPIGLSASETARLASSELNQLISRFN